MLRRSGAGRAIAAVAVSAMSAMIGRLAPLAPLAPIITMLAMLGSGMAAAGCARHRAGESAAASRPAVHNLIFILVDTLRADHLPIYGYRRDTSPNLSRLAAESLLLLNTRSQASCTFPSVNSILTSRSPSEFLGQPDGGIGLPAGIPGLAEILHGRGFHTAAVSASPIVRRSPGRFNPHGGFGRGFDTFEEDCVWKGADCVTNQALPHLQRDARPLFLYLHYLDPHGPYAPPAAYRRRFALGHPAKEFVRDGDPLPIGRWLYENGPNPGVTAADLGFLADLYDDKIAFFDDQLGRLLARLRSSGLLDDSILVFAADHGEEFLEHGDIKHCRNLFDTTIRTPLLLRVPGAAPRQVADPVENLDIVPTVLDLLGAAAGPSGSGRPPAGAGTSPWAPFEGRSLRPLVEGRPLPPGYQWAAQGALRSVSDGRFKLVQNLVTQRFALYDLAADPGETRDVLGERRRDFARLRAPLGAWLGRTEGRPGKSQGQKAAEAARRLRSVGYLE
jgi:arylsulfatase A-like enzyme